MTAAVYERIRQNPRFNELVQKRSRFAWTLAATVLVIFYGFVMMVAFLPAGLGEPIADGSMVTFGVCACLFMFVFFWLLTAIYVRRANSEFDVMTQEVIHAAYLEGRK